MRSGKLKERIEAAEKLAEECADTLRQAKRRHREERKVKNRKPTAEELITKCGLEKYKARFINNPDNYEITSHNKWRQTTDLVRYLLCLYKVPRFLFDAWLTWEENVYKNWFVAIAQGESFYKKCVKDIMTKAEAHTFLTNSLNDLSIGQNIWRAKVIANGGSPKLAALIASTNMPNRQPIPDQFWCSVILFLVKNPLETQREIQEVFDFLNNRHIVDRSFSMKGRTISSVIKLSNDWHYQMQRHKMGRKINWKGMNIPDWIYVQHLRTASGAEYERIWSIEQILNSNALSNEGNKMKHCVGGYATECMVGRSAIFTMTAYDAMNGVKKKATIEVYPKDRKIVQARGPCNRPLTPEENRILNIWNAENLQED